MVYYTPRHYGSYRNPRSSYSHYRRRRTRTYRRMPKPKSEADLAWSLAKKALRGVNTLRKLVNVEHKFITSENISVTASSTGSVTLLNGVGQGDTAQTRDGASIRFVRYIANFTLSQHASANLTYIRLILVWYYENNATAKVLGNILQDTTDTKSMIQEDNLGKFRVLMDKHVMLCDSGNKGKTMAVDLPLNAHSVYTIGSTGSAATDIQKGALYLLCVSNQATNTPEVKFSSRAIFIDN